MEIVLWFLEDENGCSQVLETIKSLGEEAGGSPEKGQLSLYVLSALDFLESIGLPLALTVFFTTKRKDGGLYTIRVVKELVNHPPLLEFRVNWRGAGAFRALFFAYEIKDIQFLVFVRATIKLATYSPEFEKIIKVTKSVYSTFIQSPEKYINLKGDEE
ncbi:hypothetical protein JI735_19545 [Paenibacillus sonchi]|uniref:Uncharacterized protein n=1 Tax=Paenibacillus sonchi TaxID=373687 RepID=A0A974P8M4_9BACL|nr:hypothetical protein [Paenibacillus sonchi]QQZ58926.1 hypothetical protein JI735_19545 [Paenibacillus sonchi]